MIYFNHIYKNLDSVLDCEVLRIVHKTTRITPEGEGRGDEEYLRRYNAPLDEYFVKEDILRLVLFHLRWVYVWNFKNINPYMKIYIAK